MLKKVKGFDGTEFSVIGKRAIGSNHGLKNEQAEQVGVTETAHTVRTLLKQFLQTIRYFATLLYGDGMPFVVVRI